MSENKVVTTEDLLKKFRAGYKDLRLVYGDFSVPIKCLNAKEENLAIIEAKNNFKCPDPKNKDLLEPMEVMKTVLFKAAFINGSPGLPMMFLDELSSAEIQVLYDEYLNLAHQVNPEFEDLTSDEIARIILDVKKKVVNPKDLSTKQAKAIGLYFLDQILPMANELGIN